MKKMAGPLVLVLMLVLCIGSWKNIFAANGKEERTYQSYLQQAERYEEKKIYIDAITAYQSAQKMQPDNLELTYKIADLYQKLGEEENYLEQLRKAYSKNPEDLDSCKILIEGALEEKEYQTAYDDVQTALQQKNCTDEWKTTMENYLLQLRAVVQYQKYLSVSEIKPYAYPTDAIASAVVKIDGKYGVVNADNELILDAEYEDAGNLGCGFFPVCQDGEYCYVDTDAYRRRVPDFAVAWLGSFAEGYAPFRMAEKTEKSDAYPEEIPKDELGKYGYLDTDMKAYAVEYDYVPAVQTTHSLMSKKIKGLFFGGQINGTSGYEEAAAQGLIAGINAYNYVNGSEMLELQRSSSYTGTLIDDLVTKDIQDPYRMLTSRSEYRLLLRQDNADERLTAIGHKIGLIDDAQFERFNNKQKLIKVEKERLEGVKISPTEEVNEILAKYEEHIDRGIRAAELLKRPNITYKVLQELDAHTKELNIPREVYEQIEVIVKYDGYIKRQEEQVDQAGKLEKFKIPENIDYSKIEHISSETKEKLAKIQPKTLAQAARIGGVKPADISILMVMLDRNTIAKK